MWVMERNEMGRACSVFRGVERRAQGVGGELRERGIWGDLDVGERIILTWIFRKLEGVVWTGWS
jgi:hypothetical protein